MRIKLAVECSAGQLPASFNLEIGAGCAAKGSNKWLEATAVVAKLVRRTGDEVIDIRLDVLRHTRECRRLFVAIEGEIARNPEGPNWERGFRVDAVQGRAPVDEIRAEYIVRVVLVRQTFGLQIRLTNVVLGFVLGLCEQRRY